MSGLRAWDAYWEEQRLAACLRDPNGNYGGCIAASWREFFRGLPTGGRVLDIASGNGAVALLGLNSSDEFGLDLEIEACDAADIDPARSLPKHADALGRIRFRGGMRAEALDYPDARFDALSSQYGIEYSQWPAALAECSRLLRTGGRLMFVCHCTLSSIYATTCDQLQSLDRLQRRQLPDRVRDLLESESQGGALHQEKLRCFSREAAAVMEELDRSARANRVFISQFLQRLGDLYQQRHGAGQATALEALQTLDRDLSLHAARLSALRDAALDRDTTAEFGRVLAAQGLSVEHSAALVDPGDQNVLGWVFRARKASSHA